MRKISIILFLFFLVITNLVADPQADISKANKAYQAGFYENAAALYEKVVNEGYTSAALYYNLGNAYYKANKVPLAILFYERALKYDPTNEDLIYNLKVANNQIIDKIDQLPQLFYVRWWESLKMTFSPDGWAILLIILFASFFITISLFLLSTSIKVRKILLPVSLSLLFFTGLVFIITSEVYSKSTNQTNAIVFAPSLPVKSSPEDSGIDLFVIHEGLKVQIIDELSGWKEIKIANGSKGWVKSETIVPV
jgi:tetratricopeptide (TPR) repeat protein